MGLFFVGVLLHEPHEEDEEDGGGGDADDDGDDHEDPSQSGDDDDIPVADCDLGDHLVVDAGDEIVEVGVDGAKWDRVYPSMRRSCRGRSR